MWFELKISLEFRTRIGQERFEIGPMILREDIMCFFFCFIYLFIFIIDSEQKRR